jgi:hypothetical protein
MGFNWNLTKEEIEAIEYKKSLLKVPITYKVDTDLEVPDLGNNFVPNPVKVSKRLKTETVDLKKKKTKNKSNKLYE